MVQWIKPGLNIDWVGRRHKFFYFSTIACLVSIAILVGNFFVRGEPVNYGTDFKGGSQIQVEFSRPTNAGEIREALQKSGIKDATVVKMSDSKRPHFFMLRIAEVTGYTPAENLRVTEELKKTFKGELLAVDHKPGSDKLYVRLKRGFKASPTGDPLEKQIEGGFKQSKVEVSQVQRFGRGEDNTYEIVLAGLDRDIRKIFHSAMGAGVVKDVPQVESVGAKMGKQLRDAGVKSIIYSLLLIFLYVALRFDFRYAPGGVISLLHDVLITTGLLALTWTEFSMTAVAALLTLAGYSINDTIVVYDRIRENLAKYRDRSFSQIINTSINETLSRTILTSFATGLTTAAMWILGTGEVKIFSFAFTFGIVIGTYSSIAVASPLTLWINEKISKGKLVRA